MLHPAVGVPFVPRKGRAIVCPEAEAYALKAGHQTVGRDGAGICSLQPSPKGISLPALLQADGLHDDGRQRGENT